MASRVTKNQKMFLYLLFYVRFQYLLLYYRSKYIDPLYYNACFEYFSPVKKKNGKS